MSFYQSFSKNWWTIILLGFIGGAVFFIVSAFLAPNYQTDISVLVIEKQFKGKSADFSTIKSVEYLSETLSKIIFTESFLEELEKSPVKTKLNLSKERSQRKKEWRKKIKVKKVANTGIIEITVFDQSRKMGEQIAQSIAWVLMHKSIKYHGEGEAVRVKLIDGPIVSLRPTKPNLWLNTLVGLILGLTGATIWVYFFGGSLDLGNKRMPMTDTSINLKLKSELAGKYPQDLKEVEQVAVLEDQPYEIEKMRKSETIAEKELPKEEESVNEEATEEMEEKTNEAVKAKSKTFSKKGAVPDNLPIFEETPKREEEIEEEREKEEKLSQGQTEENHQPKASAIDRAYGYAPDEDEEELPEPSEEEIKERLNKLLRGDL